MRAEIQLEAQYVLHIPNVLVFQQGYSHRNLQGCNKVSALQLAETGFIRAKRGWIMLMKRKRKKAESICHRTLGKTHSERQRSNRRRLVWSNRP
jgi:hypothetical protein